MVAIPWSEVYCCLSLSGLPPQIVGVAPEKAIKLTVSRFESSKHCTIDTKHLNMSMNGTVHGLF